MIDIDANEAAWLIQLIEDHVLYRTPRQNYARLKMAREIVTKLRERNDK